MALAQKYQLEPTDQEFVIEIYSAHKGLMYSVVHKYTNDKCECEDILQNTLERLMRNVKTLRGMEQLPLLKYIAFTAKSASLNYLRAQRNFMSLSTFMTNEDIAKIADNSGNRPSVESEVIVKDTLDRVRAVIDSLPERQRDLLVGKYYLELPSEELAEIAGCSPASIRVLLSRARQVLIKKLRREGIIDENGQ